MYMERYSNRTDIMLLSIIVVFACGVGLSKATIIENQMEVYSFLENYWPSGGYITELFVHSSTRCGMECNMDAGCMSVFYDFTSGICQLHKFVYDTRTFFGLLSTPVKYYKRTNVSMPSNTTCIDAPPSPDYQTAVLEDGTLLRYRIGMENYVTQTEAQTICMGEGARLMRILTEIKMLAMGSLLTSCAGYAEEFWTDGSNMYAADLNDTSQWTTSYGEQIPYTPQMWAPDTPVYPNSQNCLTIYGGTDYPNTWWNYACDYAEAYYICEK